SRRWKSSTFSRGAGSRGRVSDLSWAMSRAGSAWADDGLRSMLMIVPLDSMGWRRAVAACHQQVRGEVLFLPRLERALFPAPAVAALLQRFLAGLGTEERLARLHQLVFGSLQGLACLRQTLLCGLDLPPQ